MKRYIIKEAFNLKSANGQLLQPKRYFATEDEAQIAEMDKFVEAGSAEEISTEVKKAEPKKADSGKGDNPEDDITLPPGIGGGTQKKLAELEPPVLTLTALAAAMEREDVKTTLGPNLEKVKAYFAK